MVQKSMSEHQKQTINKQKLKIAAFGEWDTTNLGDRAILQGVTDFLNQHGCLVQPYTFGSLRPIQHHPKSQNSATESSQIYFPPVDKIITRDKSVKHDHSFPQQTIKLLKLSLRPLRQRILIQRLIPQLKSVDAILVGGGALLSDLDLHFPQSLAAVTWVAKQLKLPLICLGCSAEGEWSPQGRKIITEFIQNCDFIATRDSGTASRLAEILNESVPIFGDFALIDMQKTRAPNSENEQRILAVNIMEFSNQSSKYQQQYDQVLIQIINLWLAQKDEHAKYQVKLFTTGDIGDIARAKIILEQLPSKNVTFHLFANLEQLRNCLSSSYAVIATRLHSAILALAEGVPVIGLSVDTKINRFFSSLGISSYSLSALDEQVINQAITLLQHESINKQLEAIDFSEMSMTRAKVLSLVNELAAQINNELISVS
ncbi:putative polysaccharide pyruvyl transferase [Richelia sinica FACHB-800]|uniref:Polysaccharide pyruvyl transferase n=1 Tax=Richelia sinica FACHB-800 TaxID=1357546 RepID=A0A975T5E6_9NOST|nr:polysaccharide pyruvyl transferase family protein [Richelia sinica]MBD2664225.1 polysaccharide pyruvyl transferase family protein [Richelia sinica FACHB-800]QXE22551.1 putative polysaccharide pyruvyl transferase [Richelia sinica FACHB-800]